MQQDMMVVVNKATHLARRVSELVRAPRALRLSARQQALRMAAQMRREQLERTSAEVVRQHLPARTRFPAAVTSEFPSLAQLAEATVEQLRAVPQVGPQSAVAIQRTAQTVARQIEAEVTIRLDEMPRTAQARELVATLAAIRYADAVVPSIAEDLRRWPERAWPLLHSARGYRWWSPSRRRVANVSTAKLKKMLAEPGAAAAEGMVAEHRGGVSAARWRRHAWQEFTRSPQTFTSLLACVGGSVCAGHPEAAEGHLPSTLRQEVAATAVDTTLLRATLAPYQVFGTKYLLHQRRAILGDEMGLGKTLQALAVAAHVSASVEQARVLVVAPTSVLFNWLAEIGRHTRMRSYLLHGPDRDATLARWRRYGGIAVTSFGTLGALKAPTPHLVIVDEAHYAKNPEASRARTTARLLSRVDRAVLLTGTAMENRVAEFITLTSYLGEQVTPGRLERAATVSPSAFRREVAPVYLRRNQADVLTDLPPRIESMRWVEMTDDDWAAYERARDDMSRRRATFGQAKMAALRDIVDKAEGEEQKVLVFSFFRTVLDEIRAELGDRVAGAITGEDTPKKRQQIVDRFSARKGSAVLLAQIGAGGTGLNIQAASVVVLAEPQWTPTIEEQAIARALRRGQQRAVLVYRLLAVGTRDVEVYQRQRRKAATFDEFARPSAVVESNPAAVAVAS